MVSFSAEAPPSMTSEPANLAAFVASLSSAWHAGEIRPTFSADAKPRYLRSLQKISSAPRVANPTVASKPSTPAFTAIIAKLQERPHPIYAQSGCARIQALRTVWPLVCRRLEALPNINAMQLFEELCVQFPGRFTRKQYKTLLRRVNLWRQDARARGVVIGPKTYRLLSDKPRGRRPDDRLGALRARWGVGRMCYRVPPGLYAVGRPTGGSPVFVSANYKLSFDHLRHALAGRDGWILVLDTRGINVWCAAGKGTFGTEEIVRRLRGCGLDQVVSHRKLILPQLGAPGVVAHEVRTATGFHVVYGPVRAADLPAFLDARMTARPEMRRVRFGLRERAVLIPIELVTGLKVALPVAAGLFVVGGWSSRGYSAAALGTTERGRRLARIGVGASH